MIIIILVCIPVTIIDKKKWKDIKKCLFLFILTWYNKKLSGVD
jgi:hypothetical protein